VILLRLVVEFIIFFHERHMSTSTPGWTATNLRCIQLAEISIALQPMLETRVREVFAYKAVVTGPSGAGFVEVASEMTLGEQIVLERFVIAKTFHMASNSPASWSGSKLAIDLTPDATDAEESLSYVSGMTERFGLKPDQILLEIGGDRDIDPQSLRNLISASRKAGFGAVLRDFDEVSPGEYMPHNCGSQFLKLTGSLIRRIQESPRRQKVIDGLVASCCLLDIRILAEGVSTLQEFSVLSSLGVNLMRGNFFCTEGDGVFLSPTFPPRSAEVESSIEYLGLRKIAWT